MDLKDKHTSNWRRFVKSFAYAWAGLGNVIKYEQNMRIHLVISVIVIFLSFILAIPTTHQILLLIVIGVVLSLEIMNTAIERVVDLVTAEYHPLAKVAKDVSAGAVLLFSMIAMIVGLYIFYGPFIHWIKSILFL
ncbi:diacylglycerol kinase family protein [Anaerobacillus sp. MEB173]|uniref:diacylglycerol kinase family protein n=1 Tax=Anaerobacillus sp. MEB173 TaxID=3383345 RepID=UPI003F9268B4